MARNSNTHYLKNKHLQLLLELKYKYNAGHE